MQFKKGQEAFAAELERLLVETDTSVRRLARLSRISRRSLENWVYGHTPRPRSVEPILQIASALHLPANDTDRLLLSAGYPPLDELKRSNHSLPPQLLADWKIEPDKLLGQKSAALPVQHNLPVAATPFLGRDAECKELAFYVRRPELRLTTVTGLGGVGKTRLALETARSLVTRFDHGVYFIPLDNVTDSEGFWEAIIKGLHIPTGSDNSRRQIVENYLRNKQILLLLDNFEHLLPITAEIGRLLSQSQRLNLLITSRQALDLQAEQLYAIGGLSIKEGLNSPAFQLFVETTRRRLPGYEPSAGEAQDIEVLCAAVDGLPLALELAATWSDVLSPKQILDHLQGDLHEVWHSSADRPDRQKSLWELFDYSWQMLPKPEQEAAMRLSVLRGSFTPSAAMAIADCQPAVLKLLIQTSVLKRTSDSRLMIHPLVRQFLEQQALRFGFNLEELEDRFMEVTLIWASEQTNQLRQTLNVSNYQNLYNEWQHFERAWWLAVQRWRYELLASCWDIVVYFESRGTWSQAEAFFAATREQIPASELRMQPLLDEAEAIFAFRLSDLPRSIKLAKRALQTLAESGVDAGNNGAGSYARVVLMTSDYALHRNAATAEVMLASKDDGDKFLSLSTKIIGAVMAGVAQYEKGDYAGASETFEDALTMAGPDAYVVPNLQCYLATSFRGEGRESAAREQFKLALDRALEIDIYPAVVNATYELCLLEGDDPSTQRCREALEDLALQMGSRFTVGRVAIVNALQYLYLGHFKRSIHLMRIGVAMVWDEVNTAERTRILSTITQAYIAFGLIKTAPQVLSIILPKSDS